MRRLALPPGRWTWIAPLASLGAAAAITAIIALLLFGGDEEGATTDERPSTASRVALRQAPREDADITVTLEANEPLSIDARSPDGRWVQVSALEAGGSGWIEASDVDGLPDLDDVAVADIAATSTATSTPAPAAGSSPTATPTNASGPTLTPDYPDLAVSDVFARDNRLVVVVTNEGNADASGAIEVSVDGGPAHRIDTGKALRPGDRLESALEGEFVQRRARVAVTLLASDDLVEENAGNNVYSGVVEPDAPNDLEVADVSYAGDNPRLLVTIRNRSPIPLHGQITIGVRQTSPQDQLLVREERQLDVDVDGSQTFEFPDFSGIPLEFVRVIVSSDAISDADSSNNTFPR